MSTIQTITTSTLLISAKGVSHSNSKQQDILDYEPAEAVDIALQGLQKAGVELIEWQALLYRRMKVPVLVKDYSYLIPDDDLDAASEILTKTGLPLITPSKFQLRTGGDFQSEGRFHRITRWTSEAAVQHLALYPISFSTLSRTELEERKPYHIDPSRCLSILVPNEPSVYASILRMMLRYPRYCSTMTHLRSDLSELIGYHLMNLQGGFVDPHDDTQWATLEVDQRIRDAVATVRRWNEDGLWPEGGGWVGDALVEVVSGSGDIDDLPCKS